MSDAMTWTDERVELLRKLWGEGLSASQIAAELGGITRNAVIGKVHRLGLSGRGKTNAPPPQRPRKAAARPPSHPMTHAAPAERGPLTLVPHEAAPVAALPAIEERPREEVVVPLSERVTIMELREFMCRWPLGDPTTSEFRFCGGRAITGLPYCNHHAQVAYQPAADRKRDRRLLRA